MPELPPETDVQPATPAKVLSPTTGKTTVRDEFVELVLKNLAGPALGPNEEIEDARPSDRYVLGMLAPGGQTAECEEDEELAEAGTGSAEEGTTEPGTPPTRTPVPSSLGLSFSVAASCTQLSVRAAWGRYERTTSEELIDEKTDKLKRVWRRIPIEPQPTTLTLGSGAIAPITLSKAEPEVVLQGLVRERDGIKIVSLFLVNRQEEADKLKDEKWIFQPRLEVTANDGSPVFIRRALSHELADATSESAREAAEMGMLYRHDVEFAIGHGVAVDAEQCKDDPTRALRVATRIVPWFEVPQQTPPTAEDKGFEKLANLTIDMKELAHCDASELTARLEPLVGAYRDWIARQRSTVEKGEDGLAEHQAVAKRALQKCDEALERIKEGIELIGSSSDAAQAFQFANRAMWLQRIRSIYSEQARQKKEPDLDGIDADPLNHSWRPFQLTFILLNLAGTTDLGHHDRTHETEATADLLWFPTGGGKTEAYLGLTAYIFALRRLQGPIEGRSGEHGVAVLMRYTLRLLTLQQFQRATALVCACETIRREDPAKWGETPFRIGLWVGKKVTPNTTEQAAEAIAQKSGKNFDRNAAAAGTPVQLTNCPWCGSSIEAGRDLTVERVKGGRGRTLTYCSDKLGQCEFTGVKSPGEGLPIVVVDEELYRLLPALIIATVDKFAQMPWNGCTQMLFGHVNGYCPRHGFRSPEIEDSDSHPKRGNLPACKTVPHAPLRPPDLIIQDELHLISGPLGSMVGLYETVIDELCTYEVAGKRVRPKVIASTATIRSAGSQIRSLFLRQVEIFPPPGTTNGDNFFSLRRSIDKEPGRLYLGVCAPGKRLKAVLIRVYVALLAASQLLYEKHGKAADPYMTVLGYFNSIRELGGMRRLVGDDIRTRLVGIDRWGLAKRMISDTSIEEMTSRKSSTDIPQILDRLEIGFDPEDDRRRDELKKERKPFNKQRPYDVLLATNMISVGVDVKRIGLMVVGGQPKGTSEYIQATSRVGRHSPGVVVTVYNWARPRDLSHYERFEHYHSTFYKQVESLSVTPFASRAQDRGLSGLLVALVRLASAEFNENAGAGQVQANHQLVLRAIAAIGRRAAEVLADKNEGEAVEAQLRARFDYWAALANKTGGAPLGYKGKRDGTTIGLLESPSTDDWEAFTCLNSLRDVEPTTGLVLVDDGLGGGGDA